MSDPERPKSRPLVAADLGLPEEVVERLAGRVTLIPGRMLVRVENIRIVLETRGQHSLKDSIDALQRLARQQGVNRLTIEGVGVVNDRLSRVLVHRYGAKWTPQRTVVIDLAWD